MPNEKWIVGITDYIQPPADIEEEGFPQTGCIG
jgi:hypothetical protein